MKYLDKLNLIYTVSFDVHITREPMGFFSVECDKRKEHSFDFNSERKLKKFLKNFDSYDYCKGEGTVENFRVDVQCLNKITNEKSEFLPMNIVFGNGIKEDTPFITRFELGIK